MPVFERQQRLSYPREAVFDFFAHPARVLSVSPPGMALLDSPERLSLGTTIVISARRFGMPFTIVTKVIEMIEGQRIVEHQTAGPLRSWRYERNFETIDGSVTLIHERIEFEPPGGILGLTINADQIANELSEAFAWRWERLRERFPEKEAG